MKCRMCDADARPNGLCKKHYKIEWQRANPEKRRAQYKRYYAGSKEKMNERSKAWSKANPEKARTFTKNWEKNNPERRREAKRKWQKANPEKVRAMDSNKQARRLRAEGRHTADEVKALMDRQRGLCAVCRSALGTDYHKDHIEPLSGGGTNYISNIQLLCPPCNQSKGAKHPVEFMQSRGFLL